MKTQNFEKRILVIEFKKNLKNILKIFFADVKNKYAPFKISPSNQSKLANKTGTKPLRPPLG